MQAAERNGNLYLTGTGPFHLARTFNCGQCFRWNPLPDGSYAGVAGGRALRIGSTKDGVILYHTSLDAFHQFWKHYFDLDRDYSAIERQLGSDAVLAPAVRAGSGIRILNQEPFEALISFIISTNNNIPRIKGIIERLCTQFGNRAVDGQGNEYFTFPDAHTLAGLSLEALSSVRAGFRDKYILDAARKVDSGEINLADLKTVSCERAVAQLCRIKGVGSKVANCVALFGLSHHSAFPIDVWVRRVMQYYFSDRIAEGSDIASFAQKRFGKLGGYAQQYLFYYARENKIAN